jgi:hypothetical protein
MPGRQSLFTLVMDPARVPLTMVTASKSSSFFENIGTLLVGGSGCELSPETKRNARQSLEQNGAGRVVRMGVVPARVQVYL